MIGVFTSGAAEYEYYGVSDWAEPTRYWNPLGDLENPGLYAYSNGTRWEVRVTGLPSGRIDTWGRPILNSLIVQGTPDDSASCIHGAALASAFADGGRRRALQETLSQAVNEESLQGWSDELRPVLTELDGMLDLTEVREFDRQVHDWETYGFDVPEHREWALGAITSLLQGKRGIVCIGDIYPLEPVGVDALTTSKLDQLAQEDLVVLCQIGSLGEPVRLLRTQRTPSTEVATKKASPPIAGVRTAVAVALLLLVLLVLLVLALLLVH